MHNQCLICGSILDDYDIGEICQACRKEEQELKEEQERENA